MRTDGVGDNGQVNARFIAFVIDLKMPSAGWGHVLKDVIAMLWVIPFFDIDGKGVIGDREDLGEVLLLFFAQFHEGA